VIPVGLTLPNTVLVQSIADRINALIGVETKASVVIEDPIGVSIDAPLKDVFFSHASDNDEQSNIEDDKSFLTIQLVAYPQRDEEVVIAAIERVKSLPRRTIHQAEFLTAPSGYRIPMTLRVVADLEGAPAGERVWDSVDSLAVTLMHEVSIQIPTDDLIEKAKERFAFFETARSR